MTRHKPIVGLCGGIGAGKSRVASEFKRLGCLVIDSDRLNRDILERPEVAGTLRRWWGERVLDAAGKVDPKRVAEIVFADGRQKRRLESLVHPLIATRRHDIIKGGNRDPAVKAIILNSPLLFETNLDRLCDAIIFVEASEKRRLQRLRRARKWDLAELQRREKWQKPLAYKRSRSDFVIDNEGPAGQLRLQVIEILENLASCACTS